MAITAVPISHATKKKVCSLVRRWREILYIDPRWDIDIQFVIFEGDASDGTAADIDIDGAYWHATIRIVPLVLVNPIWPEVEKLVIHELIHLLMHDYDALTEVAIGDDQFMKGEHVRRCEQLVCTLTNVLHRFRFDLDGPRGKPVQKVRRGDSQQ